MQYNIFISTKRKDLDLASDLAKRLDNIGIRVLTPIESIDDTENFKTRINNLKKANEVVVLVTVNSVTSKRLLFDMGVATSLEIHVTPIVQGVMVKDIPPIIKQMDYIKYSDLGSYISKLQKRAKEAKKTPATDAALKQNALKRMKEALRSGRYTWRSTERLAIIGGISENEALDILRNDSDVLFSKGKAGNRIVKLKNR
jgi:hypothetical protein